MTVQQAFEHLQASLDSLHRSDLIESRVEVCDDTVLLGTNSPLDSIAFATFLPDLEDRLSEAMGREVFLLLEEIHEFNDDEAALTAKILVEYIVELTSAEHAGA